MDEEAYINQVDEQLRAYGFGRQEGTPEEGATTIFERTTDAVAPGLTHREFIIIKQLQQYDVEAIEDAIETVRDLDSKFRNRPDSTFESERWYLLIVAEKVTKPMRIRAERAAGEHPADENDAFLLPVAVDISDSKLEYDEPSRLRRVTTHGKMASNVEKYFRL